MIFIVIHHCINAIVYSDNCTLAIGSRVYVALSLCDAFCLVAVNVFVLISGWFSIRLNFKSVLNLYLMLAFYAGVLYLVHLYMVGGSLNRWCLYNTLLPISHAPGWWFVPCYVFLMLFSPLLNRACDNLSKREFGVLLLFLTIVNCYFGFYRGMSVNVNGYNLMNFIYLYMIGRYLYLYGKSMLSSIPQWGYASLFVIGSLLLSFMHIMNDILWHSDNPLLLCTNYYNHPLLIVNAITLLMLFANMHFQNNFVNYCASSVLPVYLIHDNNYAIGKWFLKQIEILFANSGGGILLIISVLSVVFVSVVVFIDKPREYLCKSIVHFLDKKYKE